MIVTVAFLPQAIRSYFGGGEALGVDIGYSVEESPLGTAGSVRLAAGRLDDTFLVISGDALCDVDLTELVEFHREKGASVTIGLKSVDNPLEFGIVVTDDDGRVERFLEKPSWGQVFSDTINTGIYVVEPEVLKHIPKDRPYDFSKELFPLLLEMGRPMYGHVCDGYWQDIGNLDQFRQANFDALDETRPAQGLRASASAATSGSARASTCTTSTRSKGRRSSATTAASRPTRRSARTRCSRRASRCASARARALDRRRVDVHRPQRRASRARSSAAPAISARTCACTRASRSATR